MKEVYGHFIDGEECFSDTAETIDVISPINERLLAKIQKGTREDAIRALESAARAQKLWAKLPAQKRAEYILNLSGLLEREKERFARLLTLEQGKTFAEAIGCVNASIGFLTFASESARRIEGEIFTSEVQDEQIWIQRVPYGVTVGILAWNYPLALACRKLGNALVCGNSMVLKPPTETPLAVLELAGLLKESGIPSGVLNIVTGPGRVVGDELVRNPITKMVTLTGSTAAGTELYKTAAENITALRLELGGNAPFIVMDDADVEKAARAAVDSKFCNCGQVCTCNERTYVHEKVYEAFVNRVIDLTREVVVGDPFDPSTTMGPKVNESELLKMVELSESARKQGARIVLGGKRLHEGKFAKGYWFEPTVIIDCTNEMDVVRKEIFGPIMPIVRVRSFDEALEMANDSEYGLSAYLFTSDVKKIMRAVNELEFGEVYVNRRNGELVNGFHNGYKKSGVGGEDGVHGLDGYLEKKTVYMNFDIQ